MYTCRFGVCIHTVGILACSVFIGSQVSIHVLILFWLVLGRPWLSGHMSFGVASLQVATEVADAIVPRARRGLGVWIQVLRRGVPVSQMLSGAVRMKDTTAEDATAFAHHSVWNFSHMQWGSHIQTIPFVLGFSCVCMAPGRNFPVLTVRQKAYTLTYRGGDRQTNKKGTRTNT